MSMRAGSPSDAAARELPESPEPAGRRRPARSQVRQALLDAAAEQFARRGIEAASVEDVAAAAGYTKGAVYSNFGSKQGLVEALVEDRTGSYLDVGLDAVADEPTLAGQARALGDRLTTASREQRDWHLLFVELWQRAVREPERAGAFTAYRDQLRDEVSQAVAAHAEEAGVDLALAPDDLATVVMALTAGLAMEHLVAPGQVPDRLLGDVLTLLVQPAP